MAREADGGGVPDLARRLNHLFAHVPRPDGRGLWTNEQAAAVLTAQGTPMSDGYISQMRNGKRLNPSARHLAAIAGLFEVPIDYFFNPDVTAKVDADLRMLKALRDAGVKKVATRGGMSEAILADLEGLMDRIRRFERLPDPEPPEEGTDPAR